MPGVHDRAGTVLPVMAALFVLAAPGGCSSRNSRERDAGDVRDSAPTGGVNGSGGRSARGGTTAAGGATGAAGGATGAAGGGGASDACLVEAPGRAAPFPTEFRFHNDHNVPVFLHRACLGVDFGISSCASQFRDQRQPIRRCSCQCDSPSCTAAQPTCGLCPPDAVMVPAGGTVSAGWDAIQIIDATKASANGIGDFSC